MVKAAFTIAICIGLLASPIVAEEAENEFQFNANVATQTVAVDQGFVIEVTLSGPGLDKAASPGVPDFSDRLVLNSVSQSNSFSWINGQVNASKTYRYLVTPTTEGRLLIPPFKIEVDNTQYQTDPIKINVVAQTAVPAPSAAPAVARRAPSEPQSGNNQESLILVEATANQRSIFEGESINYRVTLLRRVSIWSNISYEAPDFAGFITTDKPLQEDYIVSIDGQRYYALEILNKELYPIEPGEHIISPTKVSFIINPFYGQRRLDTKPISINVEPLPELGKPEGFSGAVGQFTLTSQIESKKVKQNTPITVKLQISGTGNRSAISDLSVTTTEKMRIYKSTVTDNENHREFDYIVVPETPGKHIIPAFDLHYFDPISMTYNTAKTEAIPITIIPSDTPADTESDVLPIVIDQPHYLKPILSLDPPPLPPYKNPLFWIVVALNLVGVSTVVVKSIAHKYRHSNPEKWQKKSANTAAEIALQNLAESNDDTTISSISTVVLRYISDTSSVNALGLANTQLQDALDTAFSPQLSGRIMAFLSQINALAYQPKENSAQQSQQFKSLVKEALGLIKAIGKEGK